MKVNDHDRSVLVHFHRLGIGNRKYTTPQGWRLNTLAGIRQELGHTQVKPSDVCTVTDVTTRKEGIVLFNDALNTFYLRLYGVRHMVKDHSDSERGNLLPPHGLLFSSMHHPTDRIAHTTAYVTPVVEHWLEREIA